VNSSLRSTKPSENEPQFIKGFLKDPKNPLSICKDIASPEIAAYLS